MFKCFGRLYPIFLLVPFSTTVNNLGILQSKCSVIRLEYSNFLSILSCLEIVIKSVPYYSHIGKSKKQLYMNVWALRYYFLQIISKLYNYPLEHGMEAQCLRSGLHTVFNHGQ